MMQIGGTIAAWLAREVSEAEESLLARWVEGDESPLDTTASYPYRVILEGIDASGNVRAARRTLALRVKKLMSLPLVEMLGEGARSPFRNPEAGLHHAFTLMAEIQAPECYSERLRAMLYELMAGRETKAEWVARWDKGHAEPLDGPFFRALAANQSGGELDIFWRRLLERPCSSGEAGLVSLVLGLDGMIRMPKDGESLGKPWPEKVAEGLRLCAERLEELIPDTRGNWEDRERRARMFDRYIREAKAAFLGWRNSDSDLFQAALHGEREWPEWAFQRLRFFDVAPLASPEYPSFHKKVFVWKYLTPCIPGIYQYKILDIKCRSNAIQKLAVSEEALSFLEYVYPLFEKTRLEDPFRTVRSIITGTLALLRELKRIFPENVQHFDQVQTRLFKGLWRSTVDAHPYSVRELVNSANELSGQNADIPTQLQHAWNDWGRGAYDDVTQSHR